MSLLFIGSFYLSAILEKIANGKYVGNANDLLQKAYIKGISSWCEKRDLKFAALTTPNVAAFPKSGSKLLHKRVSERLYDTECISLSFMNLPLIKHVSRFFCVYKELQCNKEVNIVFVYDLDLALLLAASRYKRKHSNIHLICIVPDLIGFTGVPNNFAYKLYDKLLKRIFHVCSQSIDLFIYLTEEMRKFMKIENKYVVIEGIYNDDFDAFLQQKLVLPHQKKKILYTGAMNSRNGVLALLGAFHLIEDKNYELILCGDGELGDVIRLASIKDTRIHFMGNIPHLDVQKLQREADLLVNPRPAFEEFTKYSFPSKTLEYFASATPVMMFRLPGVPDEYYEYCYIFDSFDEQNMCNCIMSFFDIPQSERMAKGNAARSFILRGKTADVQLSKAFLSIDAL